MTVHTRKLFSEKEQKQVLASIKDAERKTSGEIRLYIENHCEGNVLDRAAFIFKEIGMDKTALRNGSLFYLAVLDRKFAIIGDQGIHSVVGDTFWDEIKNIMQLHFQKGEFLLGLTIGIGKTGEALKKYFPLLEGDINELPDDIIFGDGK